MPLASHEAPDVPPVAVEVVLLRHDPREGFTYRRLITALGRGVSPDHAARGLALLGEHDETHLVHSTSWRATREGGITLTYLVHPDPAPDQPGTPLPEPHRIARSPRPGHPSPPDLEVGHVVAHAVRHLAFLERTDPAVAAHVYAWPGLVHALHSLPLATAGEMAHA
ncbi:MULTISPECIES: hypothetical protein [Streptomyces]|uniref:hypothetical protein n=1 Tax=Streptomyces TaxID=1883 RepID=UPI000978DAB9|nr:MULTISPECIES: hypothetical protein [unclassified Streptomyces]ONI53150.1 hypothetical protein STIB_24980 [Streptomyces sp. IB2014 011-1]RDV50838.1 hypothetical protein DDV98_15910 [Streptomyces sp. IB2014 011-12]